MAQLGALGVGYPESVGGSGDYWHVVVLAEELVRSRNAGVNMALLVQAQMATPIIGEIGTEEQKKEFLIPALAGEKIAALGVSEPDAGSDMANLKTTARRVGDDYVINGAKMWITNGTRADFITLAVRTGDAGYGGISLVTFPTDVIAQITGEAHPGVGDELRLTEDLHLDSLGRVQLASAIEERLGIVSGTSLLEEVQTLGELRKVVAGGTAETEAPRGFIAPAEAASLDGRQRDDLQGEPDYSAGGGPGCGRSATTINNCAADRVAATAFSLSRVAVVETVPVDSRGVC